MLAEPDGSRLRRREARTAYPKDEAEAIALANDTPFGLAAYFYARDIGRVWRVAEQVEGTRGKSNCAGKIWGEGSPCQAGQDGEVAGHQRPLGHSWHQGAGPAERQTQRRPRRTALVVTHGHQDLLGRARHAGGAQLSDCNNAGSSRAHHVYTV